MKLYLDGKYVRDCTGYELIIEPEESVLVQMTSDSAGFAVLNVFYGVPDVMAKLA